MSIDIVTRVRYKDLHQRMMDSALSTFMVDAPGFKYEYDDGQPRIAKTYNRLGKSSKADILVFAHDDIEFLSPGWDSVIIEALSDGVDVVGVVGMEKYNGGKFMGSFPEGAVGKWVTLIDGKKNVKSLNPKSGPVRVVDGMLMAMTREHFIKILFDEQFDGLFFYDLDFCLRSRCAVVDILVGHNKPEQYYGKYPSDMNPIGDYWDRFHDKHGLDKNTKSIPVPCVAVKAESYRPDDAKRAYAELVGSA